MANDAKIWQFLKSKGLTDAGTAGLMGNLYAESALNSTNLQGTYEKSLGYTDKTYTAAVDNGSYTNFVYDKAGYGLAQWTYWSRKDALMKYCQQKGTSIGDLDMQLEYLYKELSTNYKSVLNVLKTTDSVLTASNEVLFKFEQPKNQDETVQKKRYTYSQGYYDKFSKQEMKEDEEEMTQEQFNIMMNNWLAEQAMKQPATWSADARNWGEKNGLINGDEKGNKMYQKFLTREEFIAVLYRALHRNFID